MTDPSTGLKATDEAPAGSAGSVHGPWYRRRGVIVAASLVVVLAITVITDLPTHASRADNIASADAVVKEVNADISPCIFAVREAFTIYGDQLRHAVTVADRAHIPALLNDDQTACSFTNETIFNLSEVDVPGSAAGKQLGDIVNSVTLWATSDALGAIDAIQTLSVKPENAKALASLAKAKKSLASDRAAADGSRREIDDMLHTTITGLYLPPVPAATS